MGACVFIQKNLDLDAKVKELLASYYGEAAFSAVAVDLLQPCGEDWLASQVLDGEGEGEASRIQWEAVESMLEQRVGPTTVDLEEVQAANQQLLDAFADADAEPAGDSAEPDEYPAAPTPRPTPTELAPPDWEPASCYRCQREQARAYPPRSGHYRRNHSEAAQAGVAWHFWQWFPLGAMSRAVDAMNQRRHTEKGGSCVVPFSLAEFKVFLAVLLAMTLHSTVSLEELWDNPAVPSIKALPTRYGFAALMTQRRFNEWRAYFRFRGDPGDLPDSQYSETCQDWVEALNDYCDAITPPVERLKSKYKDGRVHKYRYEVEQRESHATYRQHFNAVDINNKLMAESNAYLCYTSFTNNKDMTRHEWKHVAAHLQADGWAKIGPANPPTINTNRVLDM
eukprot:jgi/Tetstr1/466140/TSEL_010702.t1